MKKLIVAAALSSAVLAAVPASATSLITGAPPVAFTPFATATRGTLLASNLTSGSAATITGTLAEAVYRNTSGTLDFYYQVTRTGGTREIDGFSTGDFDSVLIDGFTDGSDFDGAGIFVAANNTALADGTPSGSTTTFTRGVGGNVVRSDFGINGLSGTENSTTYILRTNATAYTATGFATVTNSTSFNVAAFQPVATSVPEAGTWAMMIAGMGMVGFAMRRRNVHTSVKFA